MKKRKNHYMRILFALILLFNPNINLVDILPDFIAYFLIFSVISEAKDLAPHFSQAAEATKKLAILCLAKIPASFITLVARSHNTQDANLIPTFALIFAVFEMILGYSLIYHASEGLFYLGERSDAEALIAPFSILKGRGAKENHSFLFRKNPPEVLRNLSLVFLFTKCFSSFLPETLLLTRKQEYIGDTAGQGALLRLYPYAVLLFALLALSVGILWLMAAARYLKQVQKEGKFLSALHALAGEELIRKKARAELCAALVFGFTLLAVASLFSLNFMPILGYALFLFIGSLWIPAGKALRISARTAGAITLVCSALLSILTKAFEEDYGYQSLLRNEEAVSAYGTVVLLALLNTVLLLILHTSVFLSLRFVIRDTLTASALDTSEVKRKRFNEGLDKMNTVFFIFGALSAILRGIYTYLKGQVFFVTSSSVTTLSHRFEFWPLVLLLVAIPYIIYSFYYFGMMKDEARLALGDE